MGLEYSGRLQFCFQPAIVVNGGCAKLYASGSDSGFLLAGHVATIIGVVDKRRCSSATQVFELYFFDMNPGDFYVVVSLDDNAVIALVEECGRPIDIVHVGHSRAVGNGVALHLPGVCHDVDEATVAAGEVGQTVEQRVHILCFGQAGGNVMIYPVNGVDYELSNIFAADQFKGFPENVVNGIIVLRQYGGDVILQEIDHCPVLGL